MSKREMAYRPLGENGPQVVSVQNAHRLLNRTCEYGLSEYGLREYGLRECGLREIGLGENVGLQACTRLAYARGLNLTRLALGFAYLRGFVTSTILGATTLAQLQENLDAWEVCVDDDTLQAIDALHLVHGSPAP